MDQILENGLFTENISHHIEIAREKNCCNRQEELTKVVVAIIGGEHNIDYIYYNDSSGDLSIIFFPLRCSICIIL